MLKNLLVSLIFFFYVCSIAQAMKIQDDANPHNMSSTSAGSVKAKPPSQGGTDQICIFCHTPHSASPKGPLWYRIDPEGPYGDGTFPLYNTVSLAINRDASAVDLTGYENVSKDSEGRPLYPNGASRLCLSCHDGATSIGVLLGNQTIEMESDFATGINLATAHPISFNYSQAVIDGIVDTGDLRPFLFGSYVMPTGDFTPLENGKMQCTTCHDPHEYERSDTPYIPPFWRHTDYAGVCDSCHTSPKTGPPPPPVHP